MLRAGYRVVRTDRDTFAGSAGAVDHSPDRVEPVSDQNHERSREHELSDRADGHDECFTGLEMAHGGHQRTDEFRSLDGHRHGGVLSRETLHGLRYRRDSRL